jgi:sugar/nucleoside kinase (ribokinase family)
VQIVVVGSIALDTIETPWGAAEDAIGGSATYASMAASYFAPVRIVGICGDDLDAATLRMLHEQGVDTAGLEVVAKGKTFRWGGRYHEDMNRRDTLFTHLNVFEHFHPKLPKSYRDSDVVFLANIHPALQLEVLAQVERPQLVAVDTMNLWIDTARDGLIEVLRHAHLLFLNDEEARQLSGKRMLLAAVESLQAMGPRWIVVKKGEHGALLFTPDERCATPAVLLHRVFDPTGAGDTFAGAFLGHLARAGRFDGDELRRAMVHGTVMASFVTEQFGVQRLAGLARSEIEARIKELADLARIPKMAG